MEPLVTVIVPCFNQGHYLTDLVESVNDACSFPHEIVIIDDGSTDPLTHRCLATVKAKSEKQQVKVISQQNAGLPVARNTGLDVARGTYIQFLDSDDLVTKGKIDQQIRELEDDLSIAVHLMEYVLCDGTRTRFWKPEVSTIKGFDYSCASFVENWERGLSIPIHCGLFRRSALSTIRFNEKLRAKEDWIFWISLAATGARFVYSPSIGAVYRQHDSNMCKDGRSMALAWLRAIRYLRDMGMQLNSDAQKSLLEHYNRFYVRYFGVVDASLPQYPLVKRDDLNFLLSFAK